MAATPEALLSLFIVPLRIIKWADDSALGSLLHVQIDHCGLDMGMTKELLNTEDADTFI
jgi:hypothetical protein